MLNTNHLRLMILCIVFYGLLYLLLSCENTIEQDGHIYNREIMPDGVEIVYHSDKCKCTTTFDQKQFEFK